MIDSQDALIKQLEVAVGELMPSIQARYEADLRLYEEQEDQRKHEKADGQSTSQVPVPTEASTRNEDHAEDERSPAGATDPCSTHDEEAGGGSKS
jgi:Ubinuclein conserved middle domain